MFADYHIHTEFSDDSDYPMEQVVQDAIAMGMNEICFTDHVDYGIKKDWDEPGEMIYRQGGLGEPDEMPLANVHYPTYMEAFNELRYLYGDRISLKIGLEFGMQTHTIDRYKKLFMKYPFEKVKPMIAEILKTVIADGKGIELNTSYHRYRMKNPMPSVDILRLYRDLGGEIITIGSDSHKAEHLGTYIEEAKHLLKELGFRYFCTYEKLKPTFHSL